MAGAPLRTARSSEFSSVRDDYSSWLDEIFPPSRSDLGLTAQGCSWGWWLSTSLICTRFPSGAWLGLLGVTQDEMRRLFLYLSFSSTTVVAIRITVAFVLMCPWNTQPPRNTLFVYKYVNVRYRLFDGDFMSVVYTRSWIRHALKVILHVKMFHQATVETT